MSSTNRSTSREKHVSDYYVTPQDTIADFLRAINADAPEYFGELLTAPLAILDPCAGGDPAHKMAYPWGIERASGWNISELTTIDVREDSLAAIKQDYLGMTDCPRYDIIITNPPFNIAMAVIEKSLRNVRTGGLVIMLLRLNYFGSKERQAFFQGNMPVLTYVHTKRPKFLNTSGTDSIEYMHAVWQAGNPQRWTKLRII